MNLRKIFSTILAIALIGSMVACGKAPATTPEASVAPSASASSASSTTADKKLTFGLVVMSTNSDYWLTLKDGAQAAVDAIGGELVFTGPADNNDIQGQVSLVENLINSKVDAILITPLDTDALSAPVEKAMDAGIPVIVIDSNVSTDKYTSFIATDNIAGGKMAMEQLLGAMGGTGEVVVINALAGIPSNDMRGQGAEEHAATVSGVKVLPQQHCLDQAEAMTATENVIIGNPNLKGIFATFNRGALGAAQAVINKGKSGDIKVVAFDADPDEIKLLEDGTIDALVVQQPYEMGRMGIEYAMKAISGEEVPKTVAPEVVVATKDNMNDEAIHKVLYPKG